MPELNYW